MKFPKLNAPDLVKRVTLILLISLTGYSHAQYLNIPKPSTGLMPNPVAGKTLYAKHCATCHGKNLEGNPSGNQAGSRAGPPLVHKIYEPSHHGDAAFQMAAQSGVKAHHWPYGDMPPVPAVTPDEVAHITAYVRNEQKKAGIY